MNLCNETITVFNKRLDSTTGDYVYIPTVISGVSWYSQIATAVDNMGLHAADKFIIRIPTNADFGGSQYVDEIEYKYSPGIDGMFTLAQGDVIVKAAVEGPMTLAQLHENYSECFTVLGVTDNRRAPNAPHWRVIGS